MTENIDYINVEWFGVKLPDGFRIVPGTVSKIMYLGNVVARHCGKWLLDCASWIAPKVLECIELVDEHAKKWATKKSVKRTEVARFNNVVGVTIDEARPDRTDAPGIDLTDIRIRAQAVCDCVPTRGVSFEIIINRLE